MPGASTTERDYEPGTVTIQSIPNLSVSMPKHGDQKVLVGAKVTFPPAERFLNAFRTAA